MSDIAIRVSHLYKKYKMYPSVSSRLLEFLHPLRKVYHKEFWALNDIHFDVLKGQSFGIVGANGSGKSTLLQLITGVLYPTQGHVLCHGAVAALLELGAGFNPEFTGKDNVIIQGTVMGFSKKEMEERLPIIEEFADIGDFINHPVKTYSSGMYVRLAFSAAIHVDPEILIVDEALAVGDAKFQSKCFRKFEDFRKAGKTILLVTHDPNAIVRYCDHALLLDQGKMLEINAPRTVINHYMELLNTPDLPKKPKPPVPEALTQSEQGLYREQRPQAYQNNPLSYFLKDLHDEDRCYQRVSYNPNEHRYGDRSAEVIDYLLTCNNHIDPSTICSHDEIQLYFKIKFHKAVTLPVYGVTLKTLGGVEIYGNNTLFEQIPVKAQPEEAVAVIHVRFKMSVVAGDYFLNLGIAEKAESGEVIALDRRYDLIHLKVLQTSQCFGLVDFEAKFSEYKQVLPSPT
ncbi:ABC transporter ATP-binding protein [Deltaproteobacteria bacterium TL4]